MSTSELIVFDADMGSDDAWSLFILIKAEKKYNVKLLGVTLVNGNTSVDYAAVNALRVLSAADRLDIRVYKGAAEPMVKRSPKFSYHGKNGFGDVSFPSTPDLSIISSENAVSFMYRVVKENPEQVTFLCVGPLTNIALAMKTYPDFSELVKGIHIMGGNYNAIGNCKSECAEFNFFTDPEAAYVVLNNSKCKLTIVPWEACMDENIDISMKNFRFNKIANIKSNVTDLMNPVDEVFLLKDEAIQRSKECYASVELNGEMTRGQVVVYHQTGSQKEFNVKMIEQINSDVCKNLLLWAG